MDELSVKVEAFDLLQKLLDKSLTDEERKVRDLVCRHQVGKALVDLGGLGLDYQITLYVDSGEDELDLEVEVFLNGKKIVTRLFGDWGDILPYFPEEFEKVFRRHGITSIAISRTGDIIFNLECLDCSHVFRIEVNKPKYITHQQLIKTGKKLMKGGK